MDWKTEAIDKLKQYEAKRQALITIPMQIAEIDMAMTSIRSARTDGTPVKGGGSKYEDRMLNCIVQKDELQRNLEMTQLWMDFVNIGLSVLDQEERKILEYLCIYPAKGNIDRLCDELFVDTRQIYRKREQALRKFTVALCGCVER